MYCELRAKDISIIEDMLDVGDQTMRKTLINSDFREAVIDRYTDIHGDLARSTVMLPTWLRREVFNIHIDENVAEGKIYTGMVNYGTALLQHTLSDRIKALHSDVRALTSSDNDMIVDIVQNFSTSVNGVKGGARRTISIPAWTQSYLASTGTYLRTEFSSMLRLTLYMAIQQYDHILEKDGIICETEINAFDSQVRDYTHVCRCLRDGEPKHGEA